MQKKLPFVMRSIKVIRVMVEDIEMITPQYLPIAAPFTLFFVGLYIHDIILEPIY
jgi:hypothetical protein